MGQPRGNLTAEQLETALREVAAEMQAAETKEDIRALWAKNLGRLGHRRIRAAACLPVRLRGA